MSGALVRRIVISAFFVVCQGAARAGEPMTLEDALASAYETNPQLEAQRASLRATDEEVAKALAGWRPNISANGSYGWQLQSQTLLGAQTTQSIPQAEQITITQPVFDGRTIPNTERAKALVDAGRGQLQVTEGTVLLNATSAYFGVLRDVEIVKIYREDIANLAGIVKNAHERLRLGDLTKTDASQASARLMGSQLQLAAAEQQLSASRAKFEHAIGRPAETLIDHVMPAVPTDLAEAAASADARNPSLAQSRAQARAADLAVDASVGALLPTFSIQALYGRSIDEIAPGVRQNGVSVIGQLTIPLYQGGAEEASVREAKEQSNQAAFTTRETERQVTEDLTNAWSSLLTTKVAAALALEQAKTNEAAYKGSVMESQVGSRSTIDILNADQEYTQSKVTAVTQRLDSETAAYQLLSVLGRMTAKDLKLQVQVYDPQQHYDQDATRWFGFGD